jgi:heme-degrading monooxygenase HmoA
VDVGSDFRLEGSKLFRQLTTDRKRVTQNAADVSIFHHCYFPDPSLKEPRQPDDLTLNTMEEQTETQLGFVAINYIECDASYRGRFEELFGTRAHAIDRLPGFRFMHVLRPADESDPYLIVSHWDDEASFQEWTRSPEFLEGHQRGFTDLKKAKEEGREPPMSSTFKTYSILTD